MSSDNYTPRPEHKFSFGLWTVGNRGRDPFGDAVRPSLSPTDAVALLAEVGSIRKSRNFDRAALSARGLQYERLDQLTMDILLGSSVTYRTRSAGRSSSADFPVC